MHITSLIVIHYRDDNRNTGILHIVRYYIINIIRPSALTNISGKRQITA